MRGSATMPECLSTSQLESWLPKAASLRDAPFGSGRNEKPTGHLPIWELSTLGFRPYGCLIIQRLKARYVGCTPTEWDSNHSTTRAFS